MNLFSKLNLPDKGDIVVLNAPADFHPTFETVPGVSVKRDLAQVKKVAWILAFVKTEEEVFKITKAFVAKAEGDVTVWFAFPKQSSKRYESEVSSEFGWDVLGKVGFDGVRGMSLDDDWSAVRFRREPFIAKMTNNPAWVLSEAGKKRAENRARASDAGAGD